MLTLFASLPTQTMDVTANVADTVGEMAEPVTASVQNVAPAVADAINAAPVA